MAPSSFERLTNRQSGRSTLASGWPERVAQVRIRRTGPPDQPAADPSSLPVSRPRAITPSGPPPTRRNESANSLRFNRRVFQHNPPEGDARRQMGLLRPQPAEIAPNPRSDSVRRDQLSCGAATLIRKSAEPFGLFASALSDGALASRQFCLVRSNSVQFF